MTGERLAALDPATEILSAYSPESLPAIPGGWATREIAVADRVIKVTLPAQPDALLDAPEVLEAHSRDGYMPYWGYLWPTALDMAVAVLKATLPAGSEALEIGAGVGLVGLAGLAAGLHVVFSDYEPKAVRLALLNAAQNAWPHAAGLVLDWRRPLSRQFPLIWGCDVIYENQNHGPILDLIEKMLAPGGDAWLADPDRHKTPAFVALARQRGFQVERRRLERQPVPGRPDGPTNLWIVRRDANSAG
jgi:predicted nicotinamide N-methyase